MSDPHDLPLKHILLLDDDKYIRTLTAYLTAEVYCDCM